MQKSHGEGQEVHALDTWIVLRPFVELVLFEDLGPWDFYETPFFTAFSFFSIYLTHGCDWCGKYRQDMTQKYIQVYHSTFMQVNSHGFAAKDGCIALDITGTCTNVLRALWACVKRSLLGHPGAFSHDREQLYLLRPVTHHQTSQNHRIIQAEKDL